MEADWSIALGADDPAIVVPWSGGAAAPELYFVDLAHAPERVDEIKEAKESPILRLALLLLNGSASPFWTAKCDHWISSVEWGDEPLDPYEMQAPPGETDCGAGCYFDLFPREPALFASFAGHEEWIREFVRKLRGTAANYARAELVLRPAEIDGRRGFGVTVFVEGCGKNGEQAAHHWGEALVAVIEVITDTMEQRASSSIG
jgi:hypothetical protein